MTIITVKGIGGPEIGNIIATIVMITTTKKLIEQDRLAHDITEEELIGNILAPELHGIDQEVQNIRAEERENGHVAQ